MLHGLKRGNILVIMRIKDSKRYRTYIMDPDGARLSPEGHTDAEKIEQAYGVKVAEKPTV